MGHGMFQCSIQIKKKAEMSRYPVAGLAGKCFKKLDTQQSEILKQNFHEISYLILLRIVNLCLEMSSDLKNYVGFVVEECFELGHITKSRCFRQFSFEPAESTRSMCRNTKRFLNGNISLFPSLLAIVSSLFQDNKASLKQAPCHNHKNMIYEQGHCRLK